MNTFCDKFLCSFILIHSTTCCLNVQLMSRAIGYVNFEQLPVDPEDPITSNGRPSYRSKASIEEDEEVFLYLFFTESSGRWKINNVYGDENSAIMYVDSWAILPYLIHEVADDGNPHSYWKAFEDGGWIVDENAQVTCENDVSIYLDHPGVDFDRLSGFYVQRQAPTDNPSGYKATLYTQIKTVDVPHLLYLFKHNDQWMIGESYGNDACLAFINSDAENPVDIVNHNDESPWYFINHDENVDGIWMAEYAVVVKRTQRLLKTTEEEEEEPEVVTHPNIYSALRYYRSIKFIPQGQRYYNLRNNMPIPAIGLGTGGLYLEEVKDTMVKAISVGYRMFDLAREYRNEGLAADAIDIMTERDNVYREDIFIISKVWPTDLGFVPTMDAIYSSLSDLRTNYIDMYLLHWPNCDPNIEWMHCQDTRDSEGTWQGSWRAMERAYAEGSLNAIGVSNFDIDLLSQFSYTDEPDPEFVHLIKPHLIQNWAEPGNLDRNVIEWCDRNYAIFQPYASGRNLNNLRASHDGNHKIKTALTDIAKKYSVTEYKLALKFMQQAGFSIIPRSKDLDHLVENLEVFSWDILSDEMDLLWGQ